MKPNKCFIKLTDHDCHTTHHQYPGMFTLNEKWVADEAGVPSSFKTHALRKHKSRWEWMTFPVHYVTYALAPDYHDGNVFGNIKVMKGFKEIAKFFAPTNADYQTALREFTDYKNHHDDDVYITGTTTATL